jgi:importin-7
MSRACWVYGRFGAF